jgi:hypothetical protein
LQRNPFTLKTAVYLGEPKIKLRASNSLHDISGSITTQVVSENSELVIPAVVAGMTLSYQNIKFRRKC